MGSAIHTPVLLRESVSKLVTDRDGNYIDATFGRGGHLRGILALLNLKGKAFAFDRDPASKNQFEETLMHESRLSFSQGKFSDILGVMQSLNLVGGINGILIDCGVSSPQLDEGKRGFSFKKEGPLDMRMNPDEGFSAADWLNEARENEISQIIWSFGQERLARKIARRIVACRPLNTTLHLAELVVKEYELAGRKKTRVHPATKTFQAVRMHVNEEIGQLKKILLDGPKMLAIGGRIVIISFHSIEDREVKKGFQRLVTGPKLPRTIPILEKDRTPSWRLIGKALKPSVKETALNPRSRTAIMRVIERVS
jgi:16S rRNA (cytosine1402-N4)-methyltransferase